LTSSGSRYRFNLSSESDGSFQTKQALSANFDALLKIASSFHFVSALTDSFKNRGLVSKPPGIVFLSLKGLSDSSELYPVKERLPKLCRYFALVRSQSSPNSFCH